MTGQSSALLPQHAALLDASAIGPDVARERQYRSVDTKAHLETIGVAKAGRSVPGLLIPIHGMSGIVGFQYRPDVPRIGTTGKPMKYETPWKQANRLDIHPRCRKHVGDPKVPMIVTEGARKADSLISAGAECVIGLSGVWNWRGDNGTGGKVALPDWQDVALNGRQVLIGYDHDVMANPKVQAAARTLAEYLRSKGATVGFLWVPKVHDDEHTGVDDWLAAGGTLGELLSTRTDRLNGPDTPHAEPVTPAEPVSPVSPETLPNRLKAWFARFICPLSDLDLDLLVLFTLHTHCIEAFYTTPRLILTSPVPGAGKTTVLEHLQRLAFHAINLSSVSSAALLTRLLDEGMRTILIDECDRSLRPDKPGVEDLLAVVNTGYKRGATRPVLVPSPGGKWVVEEHPTFSPVVLSGRSPNLPDDTMARAIVVTLLPDMADAIEDSDWELIEAEATELAAEVKEWSAWATAEIRAGSAPTQLPAGLKGRGREKWKPLLKVADMCGGRWPDACGRLVERDLAEAENEREAQIMHEVPSVALLRDICGSWPEGAPFWSSSSMVEALKTEQPDRWGPTDRYPKGLTSQRLGRFLARGMRVQSARQGHTGPRGYFASDIAAVARRLRLPVERFEGIDTDDHPSGQTGETGAAGRTGAQVLLCLTCGEPMPYGDLLGDGRHPMCSQEATA